MTQLAVNVLVIKCNTAGVYRTQIHFYTLKLQPTEAKMYWRKPSSLQIKSPLTGLQTYTFSQQMMNKLQRDQGKGKYTHTYTHVVTVETHCDALRGIDVFILQSKSNVIHNSVTPTGSPAVNNLATCSVLVFPTRPPQTTGFFFS